MEALDWRQRRYVWLTQGWYEDLWWAEPDSMELNCSSTELLEFLYQQRVLGVSHYPSALNQTTTMVCR